MSPIPHVVSVVINVVVDLAFPNVDVIRQFDGSWEWVGCGKRVHKVERYRVLVIFRAFCLADMSLMGTLEFRVVNEPG